MSLAARAKFDAVLDRIVGDFPEMSGRDELISQLVARFNHEWDFPRVQELEFLLQKRFTPDEVRHVLFFPDSEMQAALYPLLIASPPEGAPNDHPQRQVQIAHMCMLYLVHVKHWLFCKTFILSGGLASLAMLLDHDNLYLRGQVVDTFIILTSHEAFDWMKEPTGAEERQLHGQFLALQQVPYFLNGLIANADPQKTFPGGATSTLQILAMWLSWVRILYTKDRKLRLSTKLLAALHDWGRSAGGEGQVTTEGDANLLDFARQVYEDFNREPPADVDEVSISCAQKVQKTAEQLKAEANELFTSGDFAGAQDIYTEAMSLLGDQHTDQRLRAILYSNRSAAMLRLAEESTDGNKLLERCMEDCDIAIQADPGYYKAWFWLAKCHEARGELEEAVSAAQNAASVESISHQNARAVESFISSLKCRLEPAISHSSSKSKESLLAAKILSRGRAPEELESENREDENRAPASGMECPQPATVNKRRNRPQTNKKRVGGKSKRILRAIDTSPSLELAITLSALGEGKHLQAIFGEELTEERLCRTLQAIRALALSEVPTSRKGAPMLIKELAGVRRLPAVLLMIPPEDRRWASDTVMRLKEQGLLENTSDITIFLRD